MSPKTTVAIPMMYTWARIYIRPSNSKDKNWIYCREPIHWRTLLQPREETGELRECATVHGKKTPYRSDKLIFFIFI